MAPCFESATVCFIIGRRGPRPISDDKIGVGFKPNRIGWDKLDGITRMLKLRPQTVKRLAGKKRRRRILLCFFI